jgi:hypothetical protein
MITGAYLAATTVQPVSSQVVVGIVTGILTTVVLWGMKALWVHKVRPEAEKVLYNGLQIDGAWHSQVVLEESATQFTLDLKQSAGKLHGIARIRLVSHGNDFDMAAVLKGELWEGYVAFILRPNSRRSTAIMTGLLRVTEAGGVLQGYLSIRDKTSGDVSSFQVKFFRGEVSPKVNVQFETEWLRISAARDAQASLDLDGV